MPFNFPCNWKAGFVMDPVKKQRVGYIPSFNGLGLKDALAQDLTVYCPFNTGAAPTYSLVAPDGENKVKCCAILEAVNWGGGVGDQWSFSCYMSQENSNQLKALQQMTLKNTAISDLSFWIANFDEEGKKWFEECYPKTSSGKISAQLNAVSKNDIRLHVADEAVKVAPNIDVNVYNVYFEIVPAANQTATFNISSSADKNVVRPWGLIVGTLAGKAVAAQS